MIIKPVSSMEKILPAGEWTDCRDFDRLSGLKGETVSFQIAYYYEEAGKGYGRVRVAHVPEGVVVKVRTVGLVPCAYPCHEKRDDGYLATQPGLYPDLLSDITEFGFPLVSGQWRSLWVDLEIGESAAAGVHDVEIILENMEDTTAITAESAAEAATGISRETIGEIGKVQVSLEIIDGVLPKLHIPHTEWFHSDCLANYYGVEVFSEEHWRIVENFVAHAVKRGCNMILTPIFTPPLDTAIGRERRTVQLVDITVTENGYGFGYEKFERWVAMCQRVGMEFFEISHLFSQWGAVSTPKIVAMVDGKEKKLFGWHTRADSREYGEFLHVFLDSFTGELEKLGIGDRCFFHVSDEPSLEQMESYSYAKNLVKEQLKKYRMIDALSEHKFYEQGVITEPVCASDHIEPFLKDRPEKLWTYYCTSQCQEVSNRFIVLPGFRTRILGMQLYKFHIDGFLHWGYNFYNSERSLYPIDPYRCTDADGAFPSGDPFLVYPGRDGKPEDSIRSMLMDEAMADLRAMKLLEELTDRETVMECLDEKKYGELTFKKYPRSAAYISEVRERINAAIKAALNIM